MVDQRKYVLSQEQVMSCKGILIAVLYVTLQVLDMFVCSQPNRRLVWPQFMLKIFSKLHPANFEFSSPVF